MELYNIYTKANIIRNVFNVMKRKCQILTVWALCIFFVVQWSSPSLIKIDIEPSELPLARIKPYSFGAHDIELTAKETNSYIKHKKNKTIDSNTITCILNM